MRCCWTSLRCALQEPARKVSTKQGTCAPQRHSLLLALYSHVRSYTLACTCSGQRHCYHQYCLITELTFTLSATTTTSATAARTRIGTTAVTLLLLGQQQLLPGPASPQFPLQLPLLRLLPMTVTTFRPQQLLLLASEPYTP